MNIFQNVKNCKFYKKTLKIKIGYDIFALKLLEGIDKYDRFTHTYYIF